MPKIVWDKTSEHFYETGVKHGVLYPQKSDGSYDKGVAWNGLTAVTESPSGAEATAIYADDIKYLNLFSIEEFGCTVEAYTYPDEFAVCDGSAALADGVMIGQQARKAFGLCYETTVGNDVDGNDYGRKLHLIYGCMASPSEKSYTTINDSPEAITFSWEIKTTPVAVEGASGEEFKNTSCITIDTTKCDEDNLKALEKILFGDDKEPEEFDESETYEVGDIVTHSNKVYECIVAVDVPGAWNADDWKETKVGPYLPLPSEVYAIMSA